MKIKVKYFATMREVTGISEEVIEANVLTPADLYCFLKKKYPAILDKSDLRVSLNEEYVSFSHQLKDLDTVVFIPPVTGG